MTKKEKEIVEKYCTSIGGGRYVTTTKDNECYSVPTKYRGKSLDKRIDNYVIEEYDKEDK